MAAILADSWTVMARIKKVPTAGFLEVVFFYVPLPFYKGMFPCNLVRKWAWKGSEDIRGLEQAVDN